MRRVKRDNRFFGLECRIVRRTAIKTVKDDSAPGTGPDLNA